MPRSSLPIEHLLIALAEAPKQIAQFSDGLTQAQLHTAPGPGEWSANEVLAHLRSCADVWGNCIAKILSEHRPTIRAVNPRTWIKSTDYPKQKFRSSLQAFAKQRSELLATLEPLTQKDWSRQATVVGAGAALERTVEFYAQWLVEHERPHLKQIKRIANTMRRQQRSPLAGIDPQVCDVHRTAAKTNR
jgi:hypothetical protein